jgi:hypothetical protein
MASGAVQYTRPIADAPGGQQEVSAEQHSVLAAPRTAARTTRSDLDALGHQLRGEIRDLTRALKEALSTCWGRANPRCCEWSAGGPGQRGLTPTLWPE